MKQTLNNLQLIDDVVWLNYKGHEIRIEKSNLITITI